MKLATTTLDFFKYTHSQIEALKHIYNAGFRYADYSFICDYNGRTGVYSKNYSEYFKEVKKACDDIGIKLVQAHAPMGKSFLEGGDQLIADTIRCVEACGEWEIPNLVVHAGYAEGLTVEENFERNKQFFMPLLKSAEKYGINILVENFNKMYKEGVYWIDNATDLRGVIDYVNHPLFHAVWDTGHANLQEMPQDEELKLLGSHVKALHIQDNMGVKDQHLTPLFGTMSMDSVMNGLLDIGYNGYFTFEVVNIFTAGSKKREYEKDTRLLEAPLELRDSFEKFLYTLGKTILEKYDCFEE